MEGLKIETIKGPNNSEVSFCPARGGVITSLKFNGQEIFYFNQDTFIDKDKKVRGGIPILFPNAGPLLEGSIFPNLDQHGFARNVEWERGEETEGFKELLFSNKETFLLFPYEFIFSIFGKFEEDGSFTLVQEVENLEEYKEMPLSMGMHPYFKVPSIKKGNIKFNFKGGELIEEQAEVWANRGTISIDNPKVEDPGAVLEMDIPLLGKIIMDVSSLYQKIWVWSLPGEDFFCVEPIMRESNGLINNPYLIKPLEKFSASINFKFEPITEELDINNNL